MKRYIVLFFILMVSFFVDNRIMPFISIRGYYPSMVLVFSISYAIANGKWEGIWIGVFGGLLQDIYFSNVIGLNALTNMVVCLMAGILGTNIFKGKSLVPIIATFTLSIFKGFIILIILLFIGTKVNIFNIFFTSVYNMLLSIFIYKRVYRLCQKNYMQIQWKF